MENCSMNIAFVLPGGGSSGGVRCTVIAANELVRRGHQVRIFCHRAAADPISRLRQGWQLLVQNSNADWLNSFAGPVLIFDRLQPSTFARGELVIGAGMWAARALATVNPARNPRLQYLHGLTPWMPEVMREALPLDIPKLAVSTAVAEGAQAYGGGSVLAVIPNGIDCQQYYPSQPEIERNGIGTIFGTHPAKDPETVLAALQRLRVCLPFIPQYVFGSSRRPPELNRKQYWRLPSVTQARDLYSRSMVWILGSRSEGFPAPPLEAMACGCAVVVTDCGGVRDYMVNGKNGFVVPVGDVETIVAKVKLLVRHSELRRQMITAGRQTVNAMTWPAAIDKLEVVLRDVVTRHAAVVDAA